MTTTANEMHGDSPLYIDKSYMIVQIYLHAIFLVAHLLLPTLLEDIIPIDDPIEDDVVTI